MSDDQNGPFTTNAEDQAEAAKLKARLAAVTRSNATPAANQESDDDNHVVPSVEIANGSHKYVLISAECPQSGQSNHFVVSRKGAAYHRNAAEPFVYKLESHGYINIQITGGGRVSLDETNRKISIFGYSYGFGLANHAISQSIVATDDRYKDYDITISNEGY